jgi:hypothetical protein
MTGYPGRVSPIAPPSHPPTVLIQSPQNTTYNSGTLTLTIKADKSQLDDKAELKEISYVLDGVFFNAYNSSSALGPPSLTWATTLNLTQGTHTIEAYSQARTYLPIEGSVYDFGGGVNFGSVVKSEPAKLTFTVASSSDSTSPTIEPSSSAIPSPSPSPSPTLPPTIEPTSTPKQQSGFLGTSFPTEYGYAIMAVLVITVVAGLGLVYFKKRPS